MNYMLLGGIFGLDILGKGSNTTQLLVWINNRIHMKYGIQFIHAITSSR